VPDKYDNLNIQWKLARFYDFHLKFSIKISWNKFEIMGDDYFEAVF